MNELIQLENKVATLVAWKEAKDKERLTYPLDSISTKVLQTWPTYSYSGLPVFTGKIHTGDGNLTDLIGIGMEVEINGQKRVLLLAKPLYTFTANATTDVLTTSGHHNLINGTPLYLTTNGTLPAGLSELSTHYVISRTATTFQLSTSVGGAAEDFSDSGSGTHYYAKA